MATLAEQRVTLIARISSLETRVTHGDKTVEYDLGQAKMALEVIDREISNASTATKSQNITIKTSKDL